MATIYMIYLGLNSSVEEFSSSGFETVDWINTVQARCGYKLNLVTGRVSNNHLRDGFLGKPPLHGFRFHLFLVFKCRHRKRPGNTGRSAEGNFTRTWILNGNIRNSDPDQDLLAFDTCKPLHPAVLDESRDLSIIPHATTDRSEYVRLALLLLEPNKSRRLVVADFNDVV